MIRFRPNIEAMAAYVPGEQPAPGIKVVKLNTNENPYPPSPRVVEAIRAELARGGESLRLYSDPKALELRRAASEVLDFPIDRILQGNGSDELLAMLCRAFVGEGDLIAYPYPTYLLYETLANVQGARIAAFDFDRDFRLPRGLFGCDARLVFVACPNSPSGTIYCANELIELAASLKNGILVIDEAYAAFAGSDHLALAREAENVAVLRTFSKSQSLAGMRIGLVFAGEKIISGLWKVKDSYNLDRLAIAAGAASLRDTEWTENNVKKICATRETLSSALRDLGLEVLPSRSNFVFTRMQSVAAASGAYSYLKDRGILVRYLQTRLCDDALRISVGTDSEIEKFLDVFKEYLASL